MTAPSSESFESPVRSAMYNVMRQEGVCPNCGSRNKRILGGKEYTLKEIGY